MSEQMSQSSQRTALVAGAGGFIGGHLVRALFERGYDRVIAADAKPLDEWWQLDPRAENRVLDLCLVEACRSAVNGATDVFNLACDMGGMGFIEANKARCMLSVLINTHLLQASHEAGVARYFYASSACVYNGDKQDTADVVPLAEADAYPASPEDGYGWEKLFSERMCRHFREDFGLETRIVRFHNVYGPNGTWTGGREKAPAAICRKVVEAELRGEHQIEIWGDGRQTRSFMWIDDCIEGILKIHESDFHEPINLGSSELVSINELVDIVEELADLQLERKYLLDAPKGVRGRNSDNTLIQDEFGWQPSTPLRVGMAQTHAWIRERMLEAGPLAQPGSDSQQGTETPAWPASSSSTSTTGRTSQAPAST
jgi:nucleoside-diphosphate-sugar epimerase